MTADLPILYTFRRCPYAIRARWSLQAAGVAVAMREIVMRDKPPAMLAASPKGTVPVLVLPTDTPIEFRLASGDVNHAFWVPEFLFKRDVIPYPAENDQKNTWVIDRIERPGAFVGRCAEFCGAYHSMMNFEVRALPQDQFEQFLRLMMSCWRTRAYGDFWSYMLLAEGAVDIAAEPELNLWDIAALVPIVTEAGGTFTGVNGGPPLTELNAVATNGHLHERVLDALRTDDATSAERERDAYL